MSQIDKGKDNKVKVGNEKNNTMSDSVGRGSVVYSSSSSTNGVSNDIISRTQRFGNVEIHNKAVTTSEQERKISAEKELPIKNTKVNYTDKFTNDFHDTIQYTTKFRAWGTNDPAINASQTNKSYNNSTASDTSKTYARGYVDKIVWESILEKISGFSQELEKNKKNIHDSKKNIGKIMSSLAQQTKKIERFDATLSSAEKEVHEKVKGFESEVITARNSLLGVIALFASFFTFISISVNVFSRDMSLSTSISVLLVIWSCLISFIFIFMAGISKGGAFFTSSSFIRHAIFMVALFIASFTLPRVIFSVLSIT
ncbi:TPA: hypothetical protein ACGB1Y_002296 [Klebsiella aerogenes]